MHIIERFLSKNASHTCVICHCSTIIDDASGNGKIYHHRRDCRPCCHQQGRQRLPLLVSQQELRHSSGGREAGPLPPQKFQVKHPPAAFFVVAIAAEQKVEF